MDEFGFIASLLAPLASENGALGLEDDAAVLRVPQGQELVITKDAMSAGVHFKGDEPPGLIARKLLRVNLSDLAAMGAKPWGYFLGLLLPEGTDAAWLTGFAQGLKEDQETYGLALLGGDTTRTTGPLALTATMLGLVPEGAALKRSGAKPGDIVYVSGTIGDGALGLHAETGFLKQRYQLPEPRITLGQGLRGIATAAMDISDGLMQDLGALAQASGAGAEIEWSKVPLSSEAQELLGKMQSPQEAVLAGGDDYELLFTAPEAKSEAVRSAAKAASTPVTAIGRMTATSGVRALDGGREIVLRRTGYRHF